MQWRFAQLSDVRLGTKLTWLDGDVSSSLRDASRQALVEALRLAHQQHCEAVLIPGDLYTLKGIDPAGQLRFFYERAADYPSLQFIIAPGNSDAFGGNGPYVYLKPPANVRLFTEPDWQVYDLPDVTITARAHQVGEGTAPPDWQRLPRPSGDKLSVLMLRGRLEGADDGRPARASESIIDPARLHSAGFDYVALGGLHARIEVPGATGRVSAAYTGPLQCLDWDSRGPGGFVTGELSRGGAKLEYHTTARYHWKSRDIALPPPYSESYQLKLEAILKALAQDLDGNDLYKLTLTGELHQSQRQNLEQQVRQLCDEVFYLQADTSAVSFFSGLNPAHLPADSLLAAYLQRCSAEAAQGGSDPAVYELARRLGWLLFTGKGLPAEFGP